MLGPGCGLTIFALGCNRQQPPPSTRAAAGTANRHADRGWSKAMTDRQLEATVSYDAPDAAIYPPNAPHGVRQGRDSRGLARILRNAGICRDVPSRQDPGVPLRRYRLYAGTI